MSKTAKMREYMRARYQRFVDAGICTICGDAPARPNRKTCPACGEKASAISAKRLNRIRPHIAALGLCTVCRIREAMPSRSWCGVCSEANTEKAARTRQRRRENSQCTRCGKEPVPGKMMCSRCAARSSAAFRKMRPAA